MGQSQSAPEGKTILQNRAPTPEPEDPEEARRLREEKEKLAAEDRARRALAAEQRFASQKKKTGGTAVGGPEKKRKETALEQMSRENKGWRDADEMAGLRAYN